MLKYLFWEKKDNNIFLIRYTLYNMYIFENKNYEPAILKSSMGLYSS